MDLQEQARSVLSAVATEGTDQHCRELIGTLTEELLPMTAEHCACIRKALEDAGVAQRHELIKGWSSRHYIVQLYNDEGTLRLSMMSTASLNWLLPENRDNRSLSWEEIQYLKGQVGFANAWAVEVYPPDDDAVNVSNMRHIWLVEDVPFAWRRENKGFFHNRREVA